MVNPNLKKINETAEKMADVFQKNVKVFAVAGPDGIGPTHSYVSDQGLEELGNIFDEVSMEHRAAVYSTFLDKLAERDLHYDITQFMGTVH